MPHALLGAMPPGHDLPAYYLKVLPMQQPSPSTREMLINHARLRPEEVDEHVHSIRDRAWQVRPSPFIGSWTFLTTRIDQVEVYPQILQRLKSDANQFTSPNDASSQTGSPCQILDAATGLGQDLRRLIHDGVPASRIHACDIKPYLWGLSLDLWRDEARLLPESSMFREMDLSSPALFNDEQTNLWRGKFDFILVGHLLDDLNHVEAITAAGNLASLTRGPGSELLMWQIGGLGTEVSFEKKVEGSDTDKHGHFLASEESLRHIWEVEVLQRTGLRFEVVNTWTKDLDATFEGCQEWIPEEANMLECWLRRL